MLQQDLGNHAQQRQLKINKTEDVERGQVEVWKCSNLSKKMQLSCVRVLSGSGKVKHFLISIFAVIFLPKLIKLVHICQNYSKLKVGLF